MLRKVSAASVIAVAALTVLAGAARADDDGIPGVAAASAVLQLEKAAGDLDYRPTGAVATNAPPTIEPQLPPEAPPPVIEPPHIVVADRLPVAIDALMARRGGLTALGAGNWRAAREAVRDFYVARQFAPIWTDEKGLSPAGRSLLARLERAYEDGLDLKPLPLPSAQMKAASFDELADTELGLSVAAVVYALEASGARIAPSSISPLVTPKVEIADPAAALVDLAVAVDPSARLLAFNPPQPGYERLRERLAELSAPKTAQSARPARTSIAWANTSAGRPALLASADASRGANGSIRVALAAESASAERAAILANMEMWRWEPREMGGDRIEINVADYSLKLIEHDQVVDGSRVIVGKPTTPTPIFSNTVKYLLINPIWRVPESIVKNEMLPQGGGDLSYLERRGFMVKEVHGQYMVEQPPGEGNALGRLLFMFPNEHSVYLHDTPSRGLFASAKRAFSHGCIRVEQPMRLAAEVMGGAAKGWSAEKIESLLGPNERAVFLPAPLPIHIEYFTEFVDAGGALNSREDIYGLTSKVAATLARLSQD